ncbi:MAG: 30S ribosomal protein S4 [Nitrospirae bacterium GWF2_44_13]|nr:MAG: 30S ribosomal protein S4 [Nitrospirae bacterium GWF2_44_13]OGW65937.1 MAG: 30S ribosomal protein S4 [Nitrospirae bacterium RIFOXYA2_FULL_44_9]HBG93026.1 30S ribosomal protein S4 [Nitrospiraceae bacterium]
MARYTGPLCRVCRREGDKLFLKGDRCFTEKCSVERRKYPPGQHGQRRTKISDYGIQLREKQKTRKSYGLFEKQFRIYFHEAERKKGPTGELLLQLLERRLDSAVFRMGFAINRREARQFITHGHFTVNGKAVSIPSYLVKAKDVIEVKEKSRKIPTLADNMSRLENRGIPAWVEVDSASFKGKVLHIPSREEMQLPVQEQLIVELYSK